MNAPLDPRLIELVRALARADAAQDIAAARQGIPRQEKMRADGPIRAVQFAPSE
jgi:hypothetical protein